MPKLYYTTSSCSAAAFIAALTAQVNLQTEQVDLRAHVTSSGADYYKINPKGNVPALVLDDGTILNEGSAVLQWIADQNPGSVAPANGSTERYLVQSALNYVASEVHPNIGGLFHPIEEKIKDFIKGRAAQKLAYLENNLLANSNFLVGNRFTIADSYLYIVLSWSSYVGFDISPFPKVKAYFERVGNLPNVKAAHARMAENPSSVL